MYTLLTAVGLTLFLIFAPMVVGLGAKWTVVPGILIGIVAFVWMSRRVARRVEAVSQASEAEMAALQQIAQRPGPGAQAAMASKFDRAIEILQRGLVFARWQIGVATMLNARIGALMFSRSLVLPKANLAEAIPYLEKALVKGQKARLMHALWPVWAMLAVAYYKGRKDLPAARKVFDNALKVVKKESLLWSMYAWILWKENLLDDAIAVMARGKEVLPDDKKLTENLTALQNRKNMKMRSYGESWYQFGLEKPKMAGMQPQMAHPRARAGGLRRR